MTVSHQSWQRTAEQQQTHACRVALAALAAGISVVPISYDGSKRPAVARWRQYQQARPTVAQVQGWFRNPRVGLALVTGWVSGGLVALDFDDPTTYAGWQSSIRGDWVLSQLASRVAQGYEEITPKGGRHLLFFCPEAFLGERKPGSRKLASRPPSSTCPGGGTLAETREEGACIIIAPSCGTVHPSGRPYVRLRGSVSSIVTLTPYERDLLFSSIRVFDEMPEPQPRQSFSSKPHPSTSTCQGQRPGDIFNTVVSWDALLAGWDWRGPVLNSAGHQEYYLRHPGKQGPHHSATLNADGTDRLFCFSPSIGLPTGRYLDKFEFYTFAAHGGDFKAASRELARLGYVNRKFLPIVKTSNGVRV